HARTMSRPLPSQVSASTIRAPLAATPFPSTTLFRSDNGQIFAWITGGVMAALGLTVAILMITVMAEFSGAPADAWIYVILGLLGGLMGTAGGVLVALRTQGTVGVILALVGGAVAAIGGILFMAVYDDE